MGNQDMKRKAMEKAIKATIIMAMTMVMKDQTWTSQSMSCSLRSVSMTLQHTNVPSVGTKWEWCLFPQSSLTAGSSKLQKFPNNL